MNTETVSPALLEKKRLQKRRDRLLRLAIFTVSSLLMTLILMAERSTGIQSSEFSVGEPAPRSLFAPVKVVYEDIRQTAERRKAAADQVPAVLIFQLEKSKEVRQRAASFLAVLERAKISQSAGQDAGPILAQLPFFIPDPSVKTLLNLQNLDYTRKNMELLFSQTLDRGILASAQKEALRQENHSHVSLKLPEQAEKSLSLQEVMTLEESQKFSEGILQELYPKDRGEKQALLEMAAAVLQPNIAVDLDETQKRRKTASENVAAVEEVIKKNELIVQRGVLITPPQKFKIDMVGKKIATKQALSRFGATALLVGLTNLFGFFYILFFEPRIFRSLKRILLVHVILILTLVFCRGILLLPGASPYLMPAALASLLLSFLVNPRLAILSGSVMAVLVSSMAGFRADILIATLFSSTAGVFASYRVRKRIHFLLIGAAIGLTYALTLFSFRVFDEVGLQDALMVRLEGLANGILITMPVAFLILPLLEWTFDLVTDISLLELSDLNHPILKRMIVEAPGTYHHSLVVSTLAESACQAIGANALLARVGCYFHDIGKIARAEYFTENQGYQTRSQHEKLTPTMSCLIIMNHTRDGIELGRKYKLREPILRFIPEHQGTGVIYYFYKKALDQAEKGEVINVEDFRYPGPKPQTKETAVALLADSTEAASRSLKEPSPENIRELVRKIINDKFIDGQLDECNLTLRDLHKIQGSFISNLNAIFHTRVTYPAKPISEDNPDLFKNEQFSKFRTDSRDH